MKYDKILRCEKHKRLIFLIQSTFIVQIISKVKAIMMDDEGKWASAYTLTRPEEKEQMCPSTFVLFSNTFRRYLTIFSKRRKWAWYILTPLIVEMISILQQYWLMCQECFFNYREECLTKLTGQVEHCFAFVYAWFVLKALIRPFFIMNAVKRIHIKNLI